MSEVTTITLEEAIRLFKAQRQSAQLWIDSFNRHRDGPGCKNAAFAIGKVHGMLTMLLALAGDKDLPEDVLAIVRECNEIWDEVLGTALRRIE